MRVAMIESGGYLDKRVVRLLAQHGINGDIESKLSVQLTKQYDVLIVSDKTEIPNLPVLLERIVLEQTTSVIYITNTSSIGQVYNVYGDLYFNTIQEMTMEAELPIALRLIRKYMTTIAALRNERDKSSEQLDTLKLTNKAKTLLMNKGYTETEAHQFIQKTAMDSRLSKRQVVSLIIEEKIDF